MRLEAEMPPPGEAAEVAEGIRRVIAPNPGPMTHGGTNSYILGTRNLAVVDPGPRLAAHREALLRAVGGARVHAVLVTHAHRDHSEGAAEFAATVGAPVLAFGSPPAGRSPVMERFVSAGGTGGGEGVDAEFAPDTRLGDGDEIDFGDGVAEAIHTPGHFGGHLAFGLGDVVLTGDLVMGWSTTLISPPDGDVRDFIASCRRLGGRHDRLFLPGHGAPVTDPRERLDWLVSHRLEREAQVLSALSNGQVTATDVARNIYRDIPPALMPAAAHNVLAHLVDLEDRGIVRPHPTLSDTAAWSLA